MKEEGAKPNARKFLEHVLRGLDYSFESAVADLVDNSIQAKASKIEIQIDTKHLNVYIVDNGVGMDDATHLEAMKIASETRDYDEDDLGKFGTGMKSASLSMARKLTVVTRRSGAEPTVRILDLDHVAKTNDWDRLLLVPEIDELPDEIRNKIPDISGTLVVWENLRFLNEDDDHATQKRVLSHIDSTEQYLRTAFHRFLEGATASGNKISIKLNGMPLLPWNPFVPDESTKEISPKAILNFSNGASATITGYVLPAQAEFSSPGSFTEAKGAKSFQDGQGFYCYRNDRLIRTGGWLGTIAADPHLSLARLAFDFDSKADSLLGVNVVKSEIKLPAALKAKLRLGIAPTTAEAKTRYSAKGRKKAASVSELPTRGGGSTVKLPRKHTATEFAATLTEIAASKGLSSEIEKLKQAVREDALTLAQEIGW